MIDKIDNEKNSHKNVTTDSAKDQGYANLMFEYLQIPDVMNYTKKVVSADTSQDHSRVRNFISIQSNSDSDAASVESFTQGLASNISDGNCKFTVEFPNERAIYVESNVSAGRISISMVLERGRLRRRLENNKNIMERSISRQLASSVTISISSIGRDSIIT